MKKIIFNLSIVLALFLAGCSNAKGEIAEISRPLNVMLTIDPQKAEPNDPITFEAKVTHGDEEVTDANEVSFEIWRAKDKNHEMIEIPHAENGMYRLERSFQKEGTYYIVAHVTARRTHNMPNAEFVVGEPSDPEAENEKDRSMEMGEES